MSTRLRRRARRCFRLIEEILDFSKVKAGRVDLSGRSFALAGFVEEVVELLGPRAQAKGLEICCYVDERLPGSVIGDAARLRQVLFNLAGNAIKFTERGGVSIIVEPGDAAHEILIAVRGTGLGLTISRKILESMNGSIAVESIPGEGSIFRVTLALARTGEAEEEGFETPALAGSDILIVAPAALEAALLARRLQRWGAHTAVVPDEHVAAALLPERAWSAVLVDHALGTAACETLVRFAMDVPRRIVLVTPALRGDLAALKDAGFTGYLIKPVRAASLVARFAADDAFDAAAAADTADVLGEKRAPGGLSILVAEDNEIDALLARALLVKLGHRPTMAASGEAAIESWLVARAAGTPYDRLMDLHMPGMDGLEATRRIRAMETQSEAPRTPIIALTANASAEDRDACLDAGMDDFLVKPLDRERLAAALAAAGAAALAA
jgi:CheY-like chemotaxis protein